MKKVTALLPYYGSNRTLGDRGRVRRFPSEGAAKQWCERQEGCA